ncbi:thylakoid lumenal 15.0 kDa protein 2, chloroplastic [Andrographis paniculata]|uniref:thylakoid lumenal 15.0 kDa protein 2, chloroplastic n=1 Tax=Andrographis paniculata TaxID=175694 RepID=UPI0021E91563|nr:thylakoid lumenal 15.0 kDa protein 2, chloroplastic [Andrographis paniculata]XP_051114346.1 thylakoid lumenal 15.0 kDa protein 2, chloroplastic [Andrographis paniculata]
MAFLLQLPSSSLAFPHLANPIVGKASVSRTPQFRKPPRTRLLRCFSLIGNRSVKYLLSGSLALALSFTGVGFAEGKVGVNKPELLPKEFTTVIDVAGFLSDGQEKRIAQEIEAIEKDTGYKLRVLAQNYPDTPGLAIRDFWSVDDNTIVFVADPTFGNILNFNVGATVDLDIPRSFWSRLAGKYGNMFYWKEKGEDTSIESAVNAIATCLREPVGPNNCSDVK